MPFRTVFSRVLKSLGRSTGQGSHTSRRAAKNDPLRPTTDPTRDSSGAKEHLVPDVGPFAAGLTVRAEHLVHAGDAADPGSAKFATMFRTPPGSRRVEASEKTRISPADALIASDWANSLPRRSGAATSLTPSPA